MLGGSSRTGAVLRSRKLHASGCCATPKAKPLMHQPAQLDISALVPHSHSPASSTSSTGMGRVFGRFSFALSEVSAQSPNPRVPPCHLLSHPLHAPQAITTPSLNRLGNAEPPPSLLNANRSILIATFMRWSIPRPCRLARAFSESPRASPPPLAARGSILRTRKGCFCRRFCVSPLSFLPPWSSLPEGP